MIEQRSNAVVSLALNRPSSRNALDPELIERLGTAIEKHSASASTRVIVLAGRGGAFCSGIDLKTAAEDLDHRERLDQRIRGLHRLIRGIAQARQPVIACVDGAAVGFGADLALTCDLRIVSSRAYFESRFASLGLMPDGGSSFLLPRLIGVARAMDQLLLGTRVDAATALELGMVSQVTTPQGLQHEVAGLAERLAQGPPLALAAIKQAIRAGQTGTLDQALDREREGQLALLDTRDFREGLRAFLERRDPVFEGR